MVEEWSDGKVNDSLNFRQDFAVGVFSRSRASLQAISEDGTTTEVFCYGLTEMPRSGER